VEVRFHATWAYMETSAHFHEQAGLPERDETPVLTELVSTLWKSENLFPCRESNPNSSIVQLITWSLLGLSYSGYLIELNWIEFNYLFIYLLTQQSKGQL
jgi:hypothetical protein